MTESDPIDLTWRGTEQWQLELALRATPAQRLERLEDLLRLAEQSGALQRLRRSELEEIEKMSW